MAETTYFPRRLILAGAMISGVLLALAVHMLGARYGLDLGGLWRSDISDFMPAGAAIAWWLIATVGFCGGYFTATLMDSAVSRALPMTWLIFAGTCQHGNFFRPTCWIEPTCLRLSRKRLVFANACKASQSGNS